MAAMALTNAERQRRFRERRAAGVAPTSSWVGLERLPNGEPKTPARARVNPPPLQAGRWVRAATGVNPPVSPIPGHPARRLNPTTGRHRPDAPTRPPRGAVLPLPTGEVPGGRGAGPAELAAGGNPSPRRASLDGRVVTDEDAIGRMPEKTPTARGDRLVDALIVWITPDRQLEPGINRFEVRVSETGDTWIERLQW